MPRWPTALLAVGGADGECRASTANDRSEAGPRRLNPGWLEPRVAETPPPSLVADVFTGRPSRRGHRAFSSLSLFAIRSMTAPFVPPSVLVSAILAGAPHSPRCLFGSSLPRLPFYLYSGFFCFVYTCVFPRRTDICLCDLRERDLP